MLEGIVHFTLDCQGVDDGTESHCTAEVVPTDGKVPLCTMPASWTGKKTRKIQKDKDKGCVYEEDAIVTAVL